MTKHVVFSVIFFMILFIVCAENNNLTTAIENDVADTTEYIIINDFWSQIDVPDADILSLASDKMTNLYVGTRNNGIYRSNYNNILWTKISDYKANEFYISQHFNLMLIADEGPFTTATRYSADSGSTWHYPFDMPYCSVKSYLILISGEAFAAGRLHDESIGGLWISKDTCKTWSLTSLAEGNSIRGFSANSENQLFASVYNDINATHKLYTSIDQGATFHEASILPTAGSMAINSKDEILIAQEGGLIISKDNGRTWSEIGVESDMYSMDDWYENPVVDSQDNLFIVGYAYESAKLFYSPYPYGIWYSLEDGITLNNKYNIIIGSDHYIYISIYGNGLYKSTNTIQHVIE